MNRIAIASLGVLALGLAACGGGTETATGNTVVLHAENGDVTLTQGQAPTDLPPFVALPPGAAVESNVKVPKGGVIAFAVPDKPGAVIAFYARRAAANGLTTKLDSPADPDGTQVIAWSQPGAKRSMSVSVEPGEGGAGTKVGITWEVP